ncbi:MAG: M20/M25/M40 family metallo-hydrolase, partial [Bacteroidales bacterium]|nr:M20/M25/M40 family metallo-hydrolase [Bacteroidales bacterium]
AENAMRYLHVMLGCPDGVERFSATVPGLVETSNNMAIVKIEKGEFTVSGLMRSSVDTAKYALADKLVSVFALAGIPVELTGGYSGWMPNPTSGILATMKEVYKKMYGEEPKVVADHAGLECGILGGTYPKLDMVSCGPTLRSPHSPQERAHIPSVGRTWEYLKAVLEAIGEK